jgi:hypothetical protein
MSANQQVDLFHTDLLRLGNRAEQPKTSESAENQVRKSRPKRGLASIFERAVGELSIAEEGLFRQVLAVEKKRSERSGNPFMLVLLRSNEMVDGQFDSRMVLQIQRSLSSVIRDIDIAGWYEQEKAIGIIFAELTEANEGAADAILKRLNEGLAQGVAPEFADNLAITCYMHRKTSSDGKSFRTSPAEQESYSDQRQRRAERLAKRSNPPGRRRGAMEPYTASGD